MPVLSTTWGALALCVALAAGCSSPATETDKAAKPKYTHATTSDSIGEDADIEALFLHLDQALKRWNQLTLTATDPRDAQKAKSIEEDIRFRSTRFQVDLIDALETGPPFRRQIAALALGFSEIRSLPSDARDTYRAHRVSPVAPLTAALEDPVPGVVSNALLGLGLQAASDIPSERMIELLATSENGTLRINASWALNRMSDAGAPLPGILPVARRALSDAEAGVRTQCALILARMQDAESIPMLAGLMRDEYNSPAFAAARGLAFIGSRSDPLRGQCARALVSGLEETRAEVRNIVLSNLIALSERNFGRNEISEWRRWANRLP